MPFKKRNKSHGHTAFIVVVVSLSAALIGLIATSKAMSNPNDVETMTLFGPDHNLDTCDWECAGKSAAKFETIHRDKKVKSVELSSNKGYRFTILKR